MEMCDGPHASRDSACSGPKVRSGAGHPHHVWKQLRSEPPVDGISNVHPERLLAPLAVSSHTSWSEMDSALTDHRTTPTHVDWRCGIEPIIPDERKAPELKESDVMDIESAEG